MPKLTEKQEERLKALVKSERIEQDQKNRFLMEKFVDMGLAFKNRSAAAVETKGKKHRSTTKFVSRVFYSPSPEALRTISQAQRPKVATRQATTKQPVAKQTKARSLNESFSKRGLREQSVVR